MTDNVQTAIVAVMKQVGYVQKVKSPGLTYTYASETDLIAALRPPMVEAGLFLSVLKVEPFEDTISIGAGDRQRSMLHGRVHMVVRFTHAPSGSTLDVECVGEGMDAGDKALNKAMTGALKYALRQTFLIETGDDPDKERPEEAEKVRERVAKRGAASEAKAAATDPDPRTWPADVVERLTKALVAGGVIPADTAPKHVIMLLNLSPFGPAVSDADMVTWGKAYRAHRDEGMATKEAAAKARREWLDRA